MPGTVFYVKVEDIFKKYLSTPLGLITLPSDATVADLQDTITKTIQLPRHPFVLEALDEDGLRWPLLTPETTVVTQVPTKSDGKRVVYVCAPQPTVDRIPPKVRMCFCLIQYP